MIQAKELLVLTACYAIGCCASAYYLVHWRTGQDIRRLGSGTTGARNVGRVLGKPWAVATAFLDLARGAGAMALARWADFSAPYMVAALVAVIAGHLWPVQLGFRGGKGVAVSYGALLVLDPGVALAAWVIFLPLVLWMRRTSIPGLITFTISPLLALSMGRSATTTAALAAAAALVLWAHRGDLRAAWALRNASSNGTDVGHPAPRRGRS